MWQLKNYRTLCVKSSKFQRSQSKQLWKTCKHFGYTEVEFLITSIIIILIIIEAVLEHPKKTLSGIANDVYTETGSYFTWNFFY